MTEILIIYSFNSHYFIIVVTYSAITDKAEFYSDVIGLLYFEMEWRNFVYGDLW